MALSRRDAFRRSTLSFEPTALNDAEQKHQERLNKTEARERLWPDALSANA
jgi:hypothetical protein